MAEIWRPHEYQKRALARGLSDPHLALFLDPGLGKTTVILKLFQMLQGAEKVKGMLVVAPLRPCFLVWPKEIASWANFNSLTYTVLHPEWKKTPSLQEKKDVYIINLERLGWLRQQLIQLSVEDWPFDMLVVDESTKFKNLRSVRWKNIKPILPKMARRYILSGTPTPNSLLDIQGQLALVDLGKTFGWTLKGFRDKYFTQVGNPRWKQFKITSPAQAEMIYSQVSKFALRISASEARLNLPRRITNRIKVTLPPKARRHYDQLETEFFTSIDQHDLYADAAVQKRIKCHQLANGQIYEDKDVLAKASAERKVLFAHRAKLDALRDLREELNGKPMLIAYNFKHDLHALKSEFKADLHTMDGASMDECASVEAKWNAGKINMLACYPGSAALGLNLQRGGQHIVWFSLIDNWEDYHQFILRLERQGSAHTTIFNHLLIAENTLDEVLIQNLERKAGQQFTFLDRVREYRAQRGN